MLLETEAEQGYVTTNNGELTTRLSDVRIETTTIPPSPTKKVTLNVQLDSGVDLTTEDFDVTNPRETPTLIRQFLFDSTGRAHQALFISENRG